MARNLIVSRNIGLEQADTAEAYIREVAKIIEVVAPIINPSADMGAIKDFVQQRGWSDDIRERKDPVTGEVMYVFSREVLGCVECVCLGCYLPYEGKALAVMVTREIIPTSPDGSTSSDTCWVWKNGACYVYQTSVGYAEGFPALSAAEYQPAVADKGLNIIMTALQDLGFVEREQAKA